MRDRGSDESGAVVVIVALAMLALVAAVTLAVDGGRIQYERSEAQVAADAAAFAAAWADCTGGSPVTAGLDAASANGFDNDGTTNVVSVTQSGSDWSATVASTIGTTFGVVGGTTSMDTETIAIASCHVGGSGYTIFADSETCEDTIDWSGQGSVVTGDVHSEREVHVGSTNTVNGTVTYRDALTPGSSGNLSFGAGGSAQQEPWDHPMPDPPASLTVAHFATKPAVVTPPGMSSKIDMGWLESNTSYDSNTGVMQDGIYVTSGDIDLGASDLSGQVTFVSGGGVISFSGSDHSLVPHPDGEDLLAFSTYQKATPLSNSDNCDSPGIKMAGSTQSWTGTLFAPYSMVEMSGSVNTTLQGSIIAYTVRINGSDLSIQNGPGSSGTPTIALEH